MSITVLLPPLLLGALILVCLGSIDSSRSRGTPWQGAFLLGIIIWGAYTVLLTEGLSLFNGLARGPIMAGWLVGLAIISAYGVREGRLGRGIQAVLSGLRSMSRLETGLFVSILILSAILFAVAVVTPTNNVDAMDYHMPRVLEWAQNRTLAHFPTTHAYQNVRPYWAEILILHFRILWGNDQPAGLVQWLSMISALIAVSGLTRLLGGDRRTQWLSAVIAFSIPMGLLQSTTTQNDYVSAFWVVCLAFFVVLSRKHQLSRLELLGLGLALSLGMLTKGTFFPYAAILMAWYFLGRLRDGQWKSGFLEGLLVLVVVIASNGLFWSRNIQSTGGPYGTGKPLQLLKKLMPGTSFIPGDDGSVEVAESDASPQSEVSTSGTGVLAIASDGQSDLRVVSVPARMDDPHLLQILRLLAMNYVSPFSIFNQAYFTVLRSFPIVFPEQYVSNLEYAAWNHEDTAGSPLHMTLIFISIAVAGYQGIRGRFKHGLIYGLVLLGSYVLVSLIGSGSDIYVIRYQLGFFLLGAPLVSLIFPLREKLWFALAVLFLLYSIPYILFSNMRPVIGHTPWPTRVRSVFVASREELLFAINPESRESDDLIAHDVLESDCRKVGLAFSGRNLEYQIWYLLQAPQSGIEIQHLLSLPEFDRYKDPAFDPCAVVCTQCEDIIGKGNDIEVKGNGNIQLLLSEEE
jgi:4-amino-4-deoxy-L-arabinose transferase-like glycosyltransferase